MTHRTNPLRAATLAAILSGLLVSAPGCGGGGTAYSNNTRTLGEELQDLQQSYEKGIITKKEYEATKKKLMKKYTR